MNSASLVRRSDPVLAKLEQACAALSQAKTIQAAKKIADMAAAAKVYARQQQLGQESIDFAHAVRIEALRRLGEILKAEPKNIGAKGNPGGRGNRDVRSQGGTTQPPTLKEIGLTKKESSVAQTLAELPPAKFAQVRAGTATVHDVTREKRRAARVERIIETNAANAPLDGESPVPVIYADPPWQYEHVKTDNRAIENQYPTMSLDEICALPVSLVATPDAILFLWATSPKLAEAMRVIDAWSFTYRTCMVWVKDKIGMGYYARQQHELLLIASRGDLPVPLPENRPASIVLSPRRQHSEKPPEFYELIERMYPDFPRLELFARAPRDGWRVWGNQAA